MRSNPPEIRQNQSWILDMILIALTFGCLFFILLGTRPLFAPDEGRYAEIAREAVAYGNYITPHLNGIKYFEKPILFYWLEALAIHLGGLNLWSLRSINAIFGLLGCLMTYCFARTLYDRRTGILAALILGTSALYFVMVHMLSPDLTLSVFMTFSLYAFLLSTKNRSPKTTRNFIWLAATFAAFAVLTKGLIGILLPALIVMSWMAIMNEWRLLKNAYLISSFLIFLIIALPWHIIVGLKNPEFFYFYFIEQHFFRYIHADIGHHEPIWFFIPNVIIGFFPWIVFLPQTLATFFRNSWRDKKENRSEIFFLLWIVIVFTFFSFSKSKLIPYILPIFPPLSLLTARYLIEARKLSPIGIKLGYVFLALFTLVIAIILCSFTTFFKTSNSQVANIFLYTGASTLLVGAFSSMIFSNKKPFLAIKMTTVSTYLFLLLLLSSFPFVDTRTVLPLVNALTPILKLQDDIITFNQYYQDLPFYLQRRVSILNWRNEFTYGMAHQNTKEWMIDDPTFWQRWHSPKRLFVVLSSDEFRNLQKRHPRETFFLVKMSHNDSLITNKQPIRT